MMQHSPAFAIALQHSSFHSADVLCRLLCVSKVVRRLVMQYCVGQMPVSFHLEDAIVPEKLKPCRVHLPSRFTLQGATQVQLLGRWIAQHGQLLKTLTVTNCFAGEDESLMSGCISAAVAEGAESGLLQLQSLMLKCDDASRMLWEHLSVDHLTKLHMHWTHASRSDQLVVEILARFTNLRQLNLAVTDGAGYASIDTVLPALTSLTHLTKLELGSEVLDSRLLVNLPQQLQDLECQLLRDQLDAENSESDNESALQLGHLTALTRLASEEYGCLNVRQVDMLPENIQVLEIGDCSPLQPLLHLHSLQQISMERSTTVADELLKLNQLTGLTHVSLRYIEDSVNSEDSVCIAAPAAAAAWSAVHNLKVLDFTLDRPYNRPRAMLNEAVVQGFGRAVGLQRLTMIGGTLTQEAAAALPAALQQLTALTALVLVDVLEGVSEELLLEDTTLSGACQRVSVDESLTCSIAALPMLTTLCMDDMSKIDAAAALALSSATRLTYLSAQYCCLSDYQVMCMLTGMEALQDLRLRGNDRVTCASAPTIARLTLLTSLGLSDTSTYSPVTREDLQRLTGLQRLQYCSLPDNIECWWIKRA